jgi:hypothetical protein
MALYPITPVPASVSVAAMLDPVYSMKSDFGYEQRRSRYPRQLRLYQMDYLGIDTANLHYLRYFIAQHRVSALPFEWWPAAVYDKVAFNQTTPIRLEGLYHSYVNGQWVNVSDATAPGVNGLWQVYVYNELTIGLVGTTSPGVTGACYVRPYLPRAVIHSTEEGLVEGATKLIGPESTNTSLIGDATVRSRGRFSMSVTIREIF